VTAAPGTGVRPRLASSATEQRRSFRLMKIKKTSRIRGAIRAQTEHCRVEPEFGASI
jgi:hypothetical protein